MRRLHRILVIAAITAGLVLAGIWYLQRTLDRSLDGSVETVASASLQGLREQARLTAFVARFVAVVSSQQSRFGLSAERTLIMPGLVRYELDLNKIAERDLDWNPTTNTLTINLPPLILSGPEVDLSAVRQYDSGGVLLALTDAGKTLDTINQDRARAELIAQARAEVPMRLARDATRGAIERSFVMPLRAAGLQATVVAKFR